jgi:hypothetical protein
MTVLAPSVVVEEDEGVVLDMGLGYTVAQARHSPVARVQVATAWGEGWHKVLQMNQMIVEGDSMMCYAESLALQYAETSIRERVNSPELSGVVT